MFGIGDTASYMDSRDGVTVNLQIGTGAGGDADGDRLRDIENLLGSRFNDMLTGDNGDNRLFSVETAVQKSTRVAA